MLENKRSSIYKTNLWLTLLLLPGLVCGLILGIRRHSIEAANRTAELVLDYSEVQSLAIANNTSVQNLLDQFKSVGITGVAISEDLLGELAETGQVSFTQTDQGDGPLTTIYTPNAQLAEILTRTLTARIPGRVSLVVSDSMSGNRRKGNPVPTSVPTALAVKASAGILKTVGIGLSEDSVSTVRRAGLDVVARLQNNPVLTKEAIYAEAAELRHGNIKRLICAGDEVLGFRGLIPDTARAIESHGLAYGSIEFAKQKGDAQICRELDARFIRVHSIPYAEMATMAPSTAVERFVRAVKERGIRLCYIRLPETSGTTAVQNDLRFIKAISENIQAAGYRVGTAELLPDMSRSVVFLVLIGVSVVAGTILLLDTLVTLPTRTKLGIFVLGIAFTTGCTIFAGEIGLKIIALAAALVFPTLGLIAGAGKYVQKETFDKFFLRKGVLVFLTACLVTLCGAVLVVGLLADRSYMMKVSEFSGIKIAHLLPIVAVIFVMVAGLPMRDKALPEVCKEIRSNFHKIANRPLFVWHAIAVIAALGILALAIMRTGNDPRMAVSDLELKFRAFLDQLLGVRPRTKEFLIGHPALILGISLTLTRRKPWGLPLIVLGMLGQVSLLNTFCHIHMPLSLSIARALIGIGLGLLLGIILSVLFVRQRVKESQ